MSDQETINKHREFEQSIFTRASEDLKKAGFHGDDSSREADYSNWEAACRLIRVIDGMGFSWTVLSGGKGRFQMNLVKETKDRESTETLNTYLSVYLSLMDDEESFEIPQMGTIPHICREGFVFQISDTELELCSTKDNHLFILTCVIENRTTYFMFPRQKIQREIERDLPRTSNNDGWILTLGIEEINGRRKASITESKSDVTYYANNFRFIPYETGTVPIAISGDLEELFLESVPKNIFRDDLVALAGLSKLNKIIEGGMDDENDLDEQLKTLRKKPQKKSSTKKKQESKGKNLKHK